MQETTNYNLKKYDASDTGSFLSGYNPAMDIIDNVLKDTNNDLETLTTRAIAIANSATSPTFVTSTDDMTDHDKVYVLTSNGHIYHYNNNAWTDTGIVYTDTTSTIKINNQWITASTYESVLPDANNAIANMAYLFNVNTTPTQIPDNLPFDRWEAGAVGMLTTYNPSGAQGITLQKLEGSNGKMWYRYGTGGGNYTAWVDCDATKYILKGIAYNTTTLPDANTVEANSVWMLSFNNGSTSIPANLPFTSWSAGQVAILVTTNVSKASTIRHQYLMGVNGKCWSRYCGQNNDWHDWAPIHSELDFTKYLHEIGIISPITTTELDDCNNATLNSWYLFNIKSTPTMTPANAPTGFDWSQHTIAALLTFGPNYPIQMLIGTGQDRNADYDIWLRWYYPGHTVGSDWKQLTKNRTIIVGQTYSTIQAAITAANEWDTIYVPDGVYVEHVICDKNVFVIGESVEKTILQYTDADYYTPALWPSAGVFKNMTVKCVTAEQTGTNKAYAVHIDSRAAMENSSVRFENVKFVSESIQSVVGVGLYNDFELSFIDCIFEGVGSALYCHDHYGTGDYTEQYLKCINCSFITTGDNNRSTIHVQSQELEGSYASALFQRCIVKRNIRSNQEFTMSLWEDHDLSKDNWAGSTDWHLDQLSAMNNLSILNA